MDKVKLTKVVVDGLESRTKAYTIRDENLSGFSVRVYPSGRRAFFSAFASVADEVPPYVNQS